MEPAVLSALTRAGQGSLELVELMTLAEGLIASGNRDKAIDLYRLWLERSRSPQAYIALFNLAVELSAGDGFAEAEALYQKALQQNPDFAQARLNLGNLMERNGRVDEAIEQWRTALDAKGMDKPENKALRVHALNNIGRLLEVKKEFLTAADALRESLKVDPNQRDVLLHLVHLSQKMCSWPVYAPLPGVSKKAMIDGTSPLAMLAASDDPALQLSAARNFVEHKYVPDHTVVLAPERGYGHRKIRLGYLSSDFCLHAVSLLTVQMLELHDRERFEVYGFCWSREDGTEVRNRVIAATDHFIRIGSMGDREAAECIRAHEIDILIDLQGLTSGARPLILAYRPAPLQVTYLGFPGTTGLPWLDYVIADRYLIPEESAPLFSEKVLYLPDCFQVSDSKRVAGPLPGRAQNNLPEDAFVFCSFNNNYKFTPELYSVWMRVLKKVPGSVLWLLGDNEWSRENLCQEARRHQVASDRLIFAPRVAPADYLARYQLADLFLDTFPFNGGTTANDALWMGLPLLTRSGRTFASRMAGSLLTCLGLPELIATDQEDYFHRAVELARHPEKLADLKERLAKAKMVSPMFDTKKRVADIEEALLNVLPYGGRSVKIVESETEVVQKKLLNVGGNSKDIPIPACFAGWQNDLLDIDPTGKPDILCDARELTTLPPGQYEAIYCSHNLEHYYHHDVAKVLQGFCSILKQDGFAYIRVPDLVEVMKKVIENDIELDGELYMSGLGPIAPLDVIYGYRKQIESSGVDFFAHKIGFNTSLLVRSLKANGFPVVYVRSGNLEITAFAFKEKPGPEIVALLGLAPD